MIENKQPKTKIHKPKKSTWSHYELDSNIDDWVGDRLSESPGLVGVVRKNASGSISVDFKYGMKWNGKGTTFYCGSYPSMSMSEIRDVRNEAKKLLKKGVDPRVEKVAARIEMQEEAQAALEREATRNANSLTVKDMFDEWLALKGISRINDNKSIRQVFKKYIHNSIGSVEVRLLEERHLTKIYQKIVSDGKNTTAYELSKDVKQMLAWAEKRKPWRQLMSDGNPANLVDIWKILPTNFTKVRERVLSVDELLKIKSKFLDLERNYKEAPSKYGVERPLKKEAQIALWITLGCLTRIGETLKAEWKHVDFEARTWFIPKENTKKNGKKDTRTDHTIYLSDYALSKFRELLKFTGDSRWVFPARYLDGHVDEGTVSKQVGDRQIKFKSRTRKLKYRVENNSLVVGEIEWTPHDLRRTGSTMMQELGVDREIINLCQHHKVGTAIDQHYLKYKYKDRQLDAWKKLGFHLAALLESENVVSINTKVVSM